jgi:hypothetical protein
MTVRLHIDRLVVDAGLGAAAADGELLENAVRSELTRLLGEAQPGWTSSNVWRVVAAPIPSQPGAEALGNEVARAVHASLRPETAS